jgi:ribosomal 50S subunit-associated protein YjgA (DUF615 family)
MTSLFEGKTVFVIVDSDEDTYLYIADDDAIGAFYDEHPHADGQQVATEIGRELTEEENAALPTIQGAVGY